VREILALTCVVFFACVANAEDVANVTAEKLRPLQGKWAAQSFQSKDRMQDGHGIVIEIIGDTLYTRTANGERPGTVVALNAVTSPSRIDVRFPRDIGIVTCPGIFKIEGDVLTFCFFDGDGKRPERFEATEERVHLAVYKRLRE
jgi:uncharacterized protein (TIGR03067 family)